MCFFFYVRNSTCTHLLRRVFRCGVWQDVARQPQEREHAVHLLLAPLRCLEALGAQHQELAAVKIPENAPDQ